MPGALHEAAKAASAIARGMSITLRRLLSPPVTESYPDEPPAFEARYRGLHVLQRDEEGRERCVACFLCAVACPANCIYIEAADSAGGQRTTAAERYALVYNIDYSRCIFCGYCVEACPTDAITHGHGFEAADFNTATLIYGKERLLAPLPAPARQGGGQQPPESSA